MNITHFLRHPLVGAYCVTPSEHFRRHVSADGTRVRSDRIGKAGSLAMLKPEPETNLAGDAAWFGVLSWIEPSEMVKDPLPRMCEVWWVYTRQHLIDLVEGGDAPDKEELLATLRSCSRRQAWVSDHYSEEPLGSVMTIPTYAEVTSRIRISGGRYVKVDVDIGSYEFVNMLEV
ncbi:unnamed protein product [Peniophora sp. CBMAI 1063]|nr:unnamed protein product [Peniophora sp. CBMAI 1063]